MNIYYRRYHLLFNQELLLKCLFFIALTFGGHTYSNAQISICTNDNLFDKNDSTIIKSIKLKINLIDDYILTHSTSRSYPFIPVVVHVVLRIDENEISDDQIYSQIQSLNENFNSENADLTSVPLEFRSHIAKSGIHFCLASISPEGIKKPGIIRKKTNIQKIGLKNELYATSLGGSDAWDTKRYLNIWIADTGDELLGTGTFPGIVSPEKDGVVVNPKYFGINNISNKYNLGKVVVHEIGHYLGLEHIWGADASCENDDGIEDTPLQSGNYIGCPKYPQYSCGNSNMFMNYMDYVDDRCMLFFTEGQMNRMLGTLSLFRSLLINSEISCVNNIEARKITEFEVYPNPSFGQFQIQFMEEISIWGLIEVYNELGNVVFHRFGVINNQMLINVEGLTSGLYIIRIDHVNKKIIIL